MQPEQDLIEWLRHQTENGTAIPISFRSKQCGNIIDRLIGLEDGREWKIQVDTIARVMWISRESIG
jgi:hypothetical protein